MAELSRQLPLDLPIESMLEVEDFLVSLSNEAAYGLVERWPDWPYRVIQLVGPDASGKSHLAAIWARRAHAWTTTAFELTFSRVPHLASGRAVVIEDCDGRGLEEHALFH